MADVRTCPKCGGAVPPDAVDGLCARCLARVAFGERREKAEGRRQKAEDERAGTPEGATIKVEVEGDMVLEASGGQDRAV